MENNVNLKDLWDRQPVPEADRDAVFKKIEKYKRRGLLKTFLLNACLLLTIAFIIWIWIYFQPLYLSTKLGIVLAVLAMVILIIFNAGVIPLYKKVDTSRSNLEYLNTILKIKTRLHYIQSRVMGIYFLMLSAGIALYLYEYTVRMTRTWAIATYSIVFLWIGFNWFVMRPGIIRKNTKKMETFVNELQALKRQFREE